MVTSIVLTGMYNIGISNGKVKTPDGVTIDVKNVPLIRYRFHHYGEAELKYIKNSMEKFDCVHIAEVDVTDDTLDTLEAIRNLTDNIGIMLYLDVDNSIVMNGIDENVYSILNTALDYDIDYVNLRDKSTTLDGSSISRLIKQITSNTDLDKDEIGICGGPCCFYDNRACLTAVKARNIMAKYSNRDDIVVPSANHEGKLDNLDNLANCVNKCGCIRYHIYNHDVDAPASKSAKQSSTKKSNSKEGTEKKEDKAEKTPKSKPISKIKAYKFMGYK